jgi:hypothetical protein
VFLTFADRPIDKDLREACFSIEQDSPSKVVLAARKFCYEIKQVSCHASFLKPRSMNLLEEFVLRAAIEIQPASTLEELSMVLSLDEIFVRSTINFLQYFNLIEKDTDLLQATEKGEKHFEIKKVYDKNLTKDKIYYLQLDPLSRSLRISDTLIEIGKVNGLSNLSDFIDFQKCHPESELSELSLSDFEKVLHDSGFHFNSPERDKVSSFKIKDNKNSYWDTITLFVVFDSIERKVIFDIRKQDRVLMNASEILNQMLEEECFSLDSICSLPNKKLENWCQKAYEQKNSEIESRIEFIRAKLTPSQSQISQIRGANITHEFNSIISGTKFQLLVYSPWVGKGVVNQDFISQLQNLAKRGVWILIGYGISDGEDNEDRPIPTNVLEQIKRILTPSGLEAVQIHWLGRSHAKESISDQKIHVLGSNNLLSYKASSCLWDESIYKVIEPGEVKKAYDFNAKRFEEKALDLWSQALESHSIQLAKSALSIWGALCLEEFAFEKIDRVDWPQLYSIWDRVVQQGILAGRNMQN